MSLYEKLHLAYGWTLAEVDATELDYIFRLLRVKALLADPPEGEKICTIEEVL